VKNKHLAHWNYWFWENNYDTTNLYYGILYTHYKKNAHTIYDYRL